MRRKLSAIGIAATGLVGYDWYVFVNRAVSAATALGREPDAPHALRFAMGQTLVLLLVNALPAACFVRWRSERRGRDGILATVVLGIATVAVQLLVRGIWQATIAPEEIRERTPELFFGPTLFGVALMPLMSRLVSPRALSSKSGLLFDAAFSLFCVGIAFWLFRW